MNQCWFANRVVEVRRKYSLTVDEREAQVLERMLSSCASTELVLPAQSSRRTTSMRSVCGMTTATDGRIDTPGEFEVEAPLLDLDCHDRPVQDRAGGDGVRCLSFTRRCVNSRSSRLRRNGVSLSHSPISVAVLPQPRHHPVFGSRRQTSMHGDCVRLALRFMEEPRLEFLRSQS